MSTHTRTGKEDMQKQAGLSPLIVVLVIALVAVGGVVVFTMRPDLMGQTPSPTPAAREQVSATATPDLSGGIQLESEVEVVPAELTDGAQVVKVEGGSFYFKPNEIRVKKGQKVRIELSAVDMMHDFVIDELNVKLPVTRSGETNSVEFTPTTAGTFEFYCSVGQHRQMGQVGTLIVE